MKRLVLFLTTNLAVVLMLGIIVNLLGVNRYLYANGIQYQQLLVFAFVFGMGGAFISLLMSKTMAKWTMNLQVIQGNESPQAAWICNVIASHAQRAGIGMPEVAIYYSPEMNAFATGASRNNALIAVSSGLLENMREDEAAAVLGHEVSHIANGDMVTMTLLQGVLNTFVIFGARVVSYIVDSMIQGNRDGGYRPGLSYMAVSFVLELVFGIIASMIVCWYSRQREFHADYGGASLTSRQSMINALMRLGGHDNELQAGLKGFGISGQTVSVLFSTHPPIDSRIAYLQSAN